MVNDKEDAFAAIMTAEDRERAALTPDDYAAAGVEAPDWKNEPIPSLETWRQWQAAQDKALARKRAQTRAPDLPR